MISPGSSAPSSSGAGDGLWGGRALAAPRGLERVAITADRRLLLLLGYGAAVALSRFLLRAQSPDCFDSLNFLLGMSREFDMAKLQPQFPGYPVHIALGAALIKLGATPLAAATAVSSFGAGLAAVALGLCARRFGGWNAAFAAVTLQSVAWLPWMLGGAALSDSLGAALALGAFACLALDQPRPAASGVLAGLLLGTRASYWPLVGSLLVLALAMRSLGAVRFRILSGLAAGVLLWAVPFFAVVGVHNFIQVGRAQVTGHFGWWGGSVVTRPDILERARFFTRDLFYQGFIPSAWGLAAAGLAIAASLLWRRERRLPWRLVLAILLPYALWAFFAQNVIQQSRHVLPLVEGAALLLGCLLGGNAAAVVALALIACAVNAPLALDRHRVPSAAAQAGSWIEAHEKPEDTVVVADHSWRFFTELPGPFQVLKHGSLAEVMVDLSRFDRLPRTILLTSEVELPHTGRLGLPRGWHLEEGPRFCRDSRIDLSAGCLGISQLKWDNP